MKKLIVSIWSVAFLAPATVGAWDSQDALDELYRDSIRNERALNRWQREQELNRLREAQERRNYRDADYHSRQIQQLNLQDQMNDRAW